MWGKKRKIDLGALMCSKIMITNDPCSETELFTPNMQYLNIPQNNLKRNLSLIIQDNHEDLETSGLPKQYTAFHNE